MEKRSKTRDDEMKRLPGIVIGLLMCCLLIAAGCSGGGGGGSSSTGSGSSGSSFRTSSASSGGGGGGGSGGGGGGGGGGSAPPAPIASSLTGQAAMDAIVGATVTITDVFNTVVSSGYPTITTTASGYSVPSALVSSLNSSQFPLTIAVSGGTFHSSGAYAPTLRTMVPQSSFNTTMKANVWIGSELMVQAKELLGTTNNTLIQDRARAILKAVVMNTGVDVDSITDLTTYNIDTPQVPAETLQTSVVQLYGATHNTLSSGFSTFLSSLSTAFQNAETMGEPPVTAVQQKVLANNPRINQAMAKDSLSYVEYLVSAPFKYSVASEVSVLSNTTVDNVVGQIKLPEANYSTTPALLSIIQNRNSSMNSSYTSHLTNTMSGNSLYANFTPKIYSINGSLLNTPVKIEWQCANASWIGTPTVGGSGYNQGNYVASNQVVTIPFNPQYDSGNLSITVTSQTGGLSRTLKAEIVDYFTDAAVQRVRLGLSLQWPGTYIFDDSGSPNQGSAIVQGKIANGTGMGQNPTPYFYVTINGKGSFLVPFVLSLQAPTGVEFYHNGQYSSTVEQSWNTSTSPFQMFSIGYLRTSANVDAGNSTFKVKVYKKNATAESNFQCEDSNSSVFLLSTGLRPRIAQVKNVGFSYFNNRTVNGFETHGETGVFSLGDAALPNATWAFFNGTVRTWGDLAGIGGTPITPSSVDLCTFASNSGFSMSTSNFQRNLTGVSVTWNSANNRTFNTTALPSYYFHVGNNGSSNVEATTTVWVHVKEQTGAQAEVYSTGGMDFTHKK